MAEGHAPSVEEAAARADVSRTTAYRYFATQTDLLVAAHPEVVATSLLGDSTSSDPLERLDLVVGSFLDLVVSSESQQRTMLRLSLEADPEIRSDLPLRQGRAIGWILEALEPLADGWSDAQRLRLAQAVRAVAGIEALVWLLDVGGLTHEEAVSQMRWSARALLSEALRSGPPV